MLGTTLDADNDAYFAIRLPKALKQQLEELYPTKKAKANAVRKALLALINEANGQDHQLGTAKTTPAVEAVGEVAKTETGQVKLGSIAEPVPKIDTPPTQPSHEIETVTGGGEVLPLPEEEAPLPKFDLAHF